MASILVSTLPVAAGVKLPTFFSDSMGVAPANPRNSLSPPSDNWLYTIVSGDPPLSTPVAIGQFGFGQTLAGGGGVGCTIGQVIFSVNPLYFLTAGISPIVAYIGSPIYTAKQKFLQFTSNDWTNSPSMAFGYMNFIDATGTGAAGNKSVNHDGYFIDTTGAIIRSNSVAAPTTLHAGTVTYPQGTVVRLSIDQTVAGQVTLTLSYGGVVQYSSVDNNANRVSGPMFPLLCITNMTSTSSGGMKNFSCGVGL